MRTPDAGTRRGSAQGVRRGGERRRRSKRSTASGTERPSYADGLPRFSATPGELPLHKAQVQVLPVQPPEAGDAH
eukprot:1514724-Pleurochrysis_carterae.AAC.11